MGKATFDVSICCEVRAVRVGGGVARVARDKGRKEQQKVVERSEELKDHREE